MKRCRTQAALMLPHGVFGKVAPGFSMSSDLLFSFWPTPSEAGESLCVLERCNSSRQIRSLCALIRMSSASALLSGQMEGSGGGGWKSELGGPCKPW